MITDCGKYYLYRHIRLDTNQPFYIGIGTKIKRYDNYFTHKSEFERAYSKHARNCHWTNIINKTNYKVEILLESDNYEFIKQKEIEFIELYKRKLDNGLLANLTKGGEGVFGLKWDEQRKNHLSKIKKGTFASPENIEKMKIKVVEYDLEGNFIKIWNSLAEASRFHKCRTGHISKCCKFKIHKIKQRQFRYFSENPPLFIGSIKGFKKLVYQYCAKEGHFQKTWNSNVEIGKHYNIERYRVDYFVTNGLIFNNCIFSKKKLERINIENRKPFKQRKNKTKKISP